MIQTDVYIISWYEHVKEAHVQAPVCSPYIYIDIHERTSMKYIDEVNLAIEIFKKSGFTFVI